MKTPGHPATTEIAYTSDYLEFQAAIVAWQHSTNRKFPGWSEVLLIVLSLGYTKPPRVPLAHTKAERV